MKLIPPSGMAALTALAVSLPLPFILRAADGERKKPANAGPAEPGPAAAADDPVLTALEARYAAGRNADLLAVLARYADELAALRRSLLAAGDAAGAARVQLELDRVQPLVAPPPTDAQGAEFNVFEEPAAKRPVAPASPLSGKAATVPAPAEMEALLRFLSDEASAPAR
ncbi:MAG: hypothetical protein EOP86_15315 [Verrucomicrobiaceae bacterium]|nr:MAG: hypothetical protein EOP86_15315 [Verrucomicrobiaceae bacterium]